MRRDLRELAALLVLGLALGLGHLALRSDLPWFPPPAADEGLCGADTGPEGGGEPAEPPAPAASFAPAEPMSSPAPEDVP
jgi:hypothetical protein